MPFTLPCFCLFCPFPSSASASPALPWLNRPLTLLLTGSPVQVATDVSFAYEAPGYIQLPLPPAPFQQLALKFKTGLPNGLLFYSTNEERVSAPRRGWEGLGGERMGGGGRAAGGCLPIFRGWM